MNYKAEFLSLEGKRYRIYIITDESDKNYREYLLSGTDPLIIRWNAPELFKEPLRGSVATVRLLAEDYLLDIFASRADDTRVKIVEVNSRGKERLEWSGFVQPGIYSQGYCNEIEELEINCNDAVESLQYFKYEPDTPGKKNVITFARIVQNIVDRHFPNGGIKRIYAPQTTVINFDTEPMWLDDLCISEENFYSKEGEPWTLQEVMEQMMRYLGWSLIQYRDTWVMMDLSQRPADSPGETYNVYEKNASSGKWDKLVSSLGTSQSIVKESYRLDGASMSLDQVFDKITVKDNRYNIENMLPSLFDRDRLRNLNGPMDTVFQRKAYLVPGRYDDTPGLPDPSQGDCYYKFYEHRNGEWKQHQYAKDYIFGQKPNEITVPDDKRGDTTSMRNYIGASLMDFAFRIYYEKDRRVDFKPYLVLCQNNSPYYILAQREGELTFYDRNELVPLIDTESIPSVVYGEDSWLVLSANVTKTFFLDRPWVNYDGKTARKDIRDKWYESFNWCGKYYDYGLDGIGLQPALNFKLRINGKWWNGNEWQFQECSFEVLTEKLSYDGYFNTEIGIRPNTDVMTYTGPVGYRLKLPQSLSPARDIYFAICQPAPTVHVGTQGESGEGGNAELWISDISFSIQKATRELNSDVDTVYENVIGKDNVKQGPQFDFRFTTAIPQSYSYSDVGEVDRMDGTVSPLRTLKKKRIGKDQKPEENIIQEYVEQYSEPAIREDVTVHMNYGPFDIITDTWWDNNNSNRTFFPIGCERDYAYDRQTLTLLERKNVNK